VSTQDREVPGEWLSDRPGESAGTERGEDDVALIGRCMNYKYRNEEADARVGQSWPRGEWSSPAGALMGMPGEMQWQK
jgi:hypothetical protein